MKFVILVLGLGALAGCQTQPQSVSNPYRDDRIPEPCRSAVEATLNPNIDAGTKQLALEVGRANNCFGPGQTQNIRIVQ